MFNNLIWNQWSLHLNLIQHEFLLTSPIMWSLWLNQLNGHTWSWSKIIYRKFFIWLKKGKQIKPDALKSYIYNEIRIQIVNIKHKGKTTTENRACGWRPSQKSINQSVKLCLKCRITTQDGLTLTQTYRVKNTMKILWVTFAKSSVRQGSSFCEMKIASIIWKKKWWKKMWPVACKQTEKQTNSQTRRLTIRWIRKY